MSKHKYQEIAERALESMRRDEIVELLTKPKQHEASDYAASENKLNGGKDDVEK